jgi:hypothetical protein
VRRKLIEIREAPDVTIWTSGERLVITQALSLMKNPQNHAKIPRSANCMLNPEQKLTGATGRRKLRFCFMLSGDDRDRTGNLLVANQALEPSVNRF